ncbi:MAG: hypothetical protein DMG12_00725 [Acidobacteria bacterium]|nr:MAG: hypothetical protein DMG12_00725 [Acidobacteriota bacterium]
MNTKHFKFSVGLRVILVLASVAFTVTVGLVGRVDGQLNQTPANAEVHVLHIRGPVYMIVGAGGNITASVGPDGVLMVDTGLAQMTDKVLAALRQLQTDVNTNGIGEWKYAAETRSNVPRMRDTNPPPKPIRYIIDTHVHPDHTGGNEKVSAAGRTITGGNVSGDIRNAAEGAAIIAHENVLVRIHFMNGEGVQIIHIPNAHTDGDSLVYFRGSDVIATGDLFVTTSYPIIDIERGGNVQGIIDALNRILDLSIAEFRTEGGTMIVPGHGRLCDSADVAYYRDMVTIIRDRIQEMIKKGMTLDLVKAAKPTRDYDPRYGATTGFWTTDMFIEAVYKSLSARK